MKNKILMLILVGLFLVTGVYGLGTVTLQTPANGATIAGSALQLINITWTPVSDAVVNCTLYVTSASTANSTSYPLFNLTNATSGIPSQVNTTINFSAIRFEDSNDYVFTARCDNGTSSSDTSTSIIVDYTTPTTPTVNTPASGSILDNTDVLSFTVGDSSTTSCQFLFDNQPIITGSYSGGTCNYTIDRYTLPNLLYNNVRVRASDSTNTTDSAANSYTIRNAAFNSNPLSAGGTAEVSAENAQQLTGGMSNNQKLGILVLAVAIFYMFFYKNK